MIDAASCKHVSKNELTPGGTIAAISAIRSSGIGPGPLGIADTKPIAFAPASIAIHASSMLAMQQILIRGLSVGFIKFFPAKAQRRKESPLKRGSALRLCAFAGVILSLDHRQFDHRKSAGVSLHCDRRRS